MTLKRFLGRGSKKAAKTPRSLQRHSAAIDEALFADLGLEPGSTVMFSNPPPSPLDSGPGTILGPLEPFAVPSSSGAPGIAGSAGSSSLPPLPSDPPVVAGSAGLSSLPPLPSCFSGIAGSVSSPSASASPGSAFSFDIGDGAAAAAGPFDLGGGVSPLVSESDELLLNQIGGIEIDAFKVDPSAQKAHDAELRRKFEKTLSKMVDDKGLTRVERLLQTFQQEIEDIESRGGKVPWRDFIGRIPLYFTPEEHSASRAIIQRFQNCSYARKSNMLDERENRHKTEAGARLAELVRTIVRPGAIATLSEEAIVELRRGVADWDRAVGQCRKRRARKRPNTDTSMAGQYRKMMWENSRRQKD